MTIIPDDKDWTWVLERPCQDCGFDATRIDQATTGQLVRENATTWIEVLERGDVRVRPRSDKWSDLEYACHVRDVYRIMDQRLALMLAENNPLFQNWDQDETAIAERYDLQDPATVTSELLAAAESYARRYDLVTEPQWPRPGRRSNGSLFTVETLAHYGLHDPQHHLWDVGVTS